MQFSPLQSRLVASVVASCLLLLLYLALFPPNFALAAELEQISPLIPDGFNFLPDPDVGGDVLDPAYQPDFTPFDRSIMGRAPPEMTVLKNNEARPMNVIEGTSQYFLFTLPTVSGREAEEDRLELRAEHKTLQEEDAGAGAGAGTTEHEVAQETEEQNLAKRQTSRRVYISANTCEQPQPIDASKTTLDPPQLILFVSTSKDNMAPGPSADSKSQDFVAFEEGAVMYNLTTDKEVYIGIHAPNVSDAFSGIYNVRVAASIDSYYYNYDGRVKGDAQLILVDTDSQGALLITQDLTNKTDPEVEEQIMRTEPYVLFAHNKNDRSINGVKHSFCGLQNYAQIAATRDGRRKNMVKSSMTTKRGQSNRPKQQFFFSGLNSSAEYISILARDGPPLSKRETETVAGGGGEIFNATSFKTKSNHGNCALVIDLDFCDQIAYSVPSNPNFGSSAELAKFYDDYASAMYANFNKSLSQIACEAPSSQRYSLARNCTDCASAYKDWLCLVTIPRCEDFDTNADWLQPRAISQPFPDGTMLSTGILNTIPNTTSHNSSRNPLIDEIIKPGPYKELLPCDDLCYKLVQSCPAAMGFGCPTPKGVGFAGNYFHRDMSGVLNCNYPGSAYFISASGRAKVVDWRVLVLVFGAVVVGFGV